MNEFWKRRACVILTGASKGIGQGMAIEIGKCLMPESTMVLIARDANGLENTKESLLKENGEISVKCHSVNLSDSDVKTFEQIIRPIDGSEYKLFVLIHNAGSVGNLNHLTADMNDRNEWDKYMSLNLYSVTCLTSVFLSEFGGFDDAERCIVNITSMLGIKPMRSVGYYCVGKASREMYFRLLAVENPGLNVFSYCPGPVMTDMYKHICSNTKDNGIREQLTSQIEGLVQIKDTSKKLVKVLETKNYASGDRIDYYHV